MVIAALVVFALLLVAWILAPAEADRHRHPDGLVELVEGMPRAA